MRRRTLESKLKTSVRAGECLPFGNYKESCSDISCNNGKLSAKCKANDGNVYSITTIPVAFTDKYSNLNGRLVKSQDWYN